jgi:hypothetical protein
LSITVKTSDGSVYNIDEERKTWTRSGSALFGARDFKLPDTGEYQQFELKLGERMLISIGPEDQILTSRVTEIVDGKVSQHQDPWRDTSPSKMSDAWYSKPDIS